MSRYLIDGAIAAKNFFKAKLDELGHSGGLGLPDLPDNVLAFPVSQRVTSELRYEELPMLYKMTSRELVTVLAALRARQDEIGSGIDRYNIVATDGGAQTAMTEREIDQLCTSLMVGAGKSLLTY